MVGVLYSEIEKGKPIAKSFFIKAKADSRVRLSTRMLLNIQNTTLQVLCSSLRFNILSNILLFDMIMAFCMANIFYLQRLLFFLW